MSPDPSRRRSTLAVATLAAGLSLAAASTTLAQGPSVSVVPQVLGSGSSTLTVTGTGFATAGSGVYVVFGPITEAPTYYSDPSIYGAFTWVHAGAGESPVEAVLAPDGSFSTTLEVSSTFTTPAGDIDCTTTACAVITFAAHGSPDRSQDTCVALVVGDVAPSPSPVTGDAPDPCVAITGPGPVASDPPGEAPPSAAASATP